MYKQAIAMYKDGMSTKEIGEKYGVSKTTISNWLKRSNIERRHFNHKHSFEFCQQIGRDYEKDDCTVEELAEKYGLSVGMIKRLALNHGFSRSFKTVFKPIKVAMIDEDGNVLQIFNSVSEASESTNTNPTSISQCFSGRIKHAGGHRWKKMSE